MARYKLTIEYNGLEFVGWQRQANGIGVQQVIEEAIEKFVGSFCTLHVAGRTDAGVHALGQVAHFEIDKEFDGYTVQRAINFYMKHLPVVILKAERVDDDFHARFSARERAYLYRLNMRRAPLALDRGKVWWLPRELDVAAMRDAAQVLLGHHDFTTFRATQCQADSPMRTLDFFDVWPDRDEVRFNIRARSFLHHQVRNMVGTLALVGEGKWTRDDVKAALLAKDRRKGGPTAPACGLYLVEVLY